MKFYNPKDKEFNEVLKLIKPKNFLKKMVSLKMIEEETKDYGSDVYNLCNNAVAWILSQLRNTYYIYEVNIAQGDFEGRDHSWIIVGDYYLDLTLAQFIKSPKLAITKRKEVRGYNVYTIKNPIEYAESLLVN